MAIFSINSTILLCLLLALSACENSAHSDDKTVTTENSQATMKDGHSSKNALDWAGEYEGTLPCADCEGIKTLIELKADHSFTKQTEYLGKKSATYTEAGTFTWNDDGSTITTHTKNERHSYKVREGSILMLDARDKEITGNLANKYVLTKGSNH